MLVRNRGSIRGSGFRVLEVGTWAKDDLCVNSLPEPSLQVQREWDNHATRDADSAPNPVSTKLDRGFTLTPNNLPF